MTFSVAKIRLALTDLFKKLRDLMHRSLRSLNLSNRDGACLCEIGLVDFETDKFFHATALRGDGGISNPEKRIEHCLEARNAVKFDAPFCQLDGKRPPGAGRSFSRLWIVFVRNEPGIAATPQITPASVTPAGDIAFILVREHQERAGLTRRGRSL